MLILLDSIESFFSPSCLVENTHGLSAVTGMPECYDSMKTQLLEKRKEK